MGTRSRFIRGLAVDWWWTGGGLVVDWWWAGGGLVVGWWWAGGGLVVDWWWAGGGLVVGWWWAGDNGKRKGDSPETAVRFKPFTARGIMIFAPMDRGCTIPFSAIFDMPGVSCFVNDDVIHY
ncbi:MAG: hypothetical protein ACTSUE_21615 [Promethearchaeota archaeon]